MSKNALNLIAAIGFTIAAVAFLVTDPIRLGVLFAVLAVLSFAQVAVARTRGTA